MTSSVQPDDRAPILTADLLVVGGGLGGIAATLTACRLGLRVVLSEETRWLGGQLTAQAVPPDEHPWIESALVSPSYARLRSLIRDHYRRNFPLTEDAAANPLLNPGAGFVSRLCHEPRVGVAALEEMLSPWLSAARLRLLQPFRPTAVERDGRRITAVRLTDPEGETVTVRARWVVDATELGDLLELAELDHVIGAESRSQTGELHAPDHPDPSDQQAISWCCALEWAPGHEDMLGRPADYQRFATQVADFWPGPQLSFTDVDPVSLQVRTRPIFASDPDASATSNDKDLWHYRRVRSLANLRPGTPGGEITLVNWPQIDYWDAPLLGVDPADRLAAESDARALTESFVWWLQNEAPRWDGGTGYPELRLRPDVTGTTDGLAMAPYIRESRRIRARFTITEGHIGREMRGEGAGSELFADSVGIGYYRIDLHPSTAGRSYVDIDCFPFQIPLGALIPTDVDNLLPANKNIGTTHITNGAYRLHPVEWSIGEAVGALTAFCSERSTDPQKVHEQVNLRQDFRRVLSADLGLTLGWPDDIRRGAPTHDTANKAVGPHSAPVS